MLKKNFFINGILALSLIGQHTAWAQTTKKVERPPQFVLLAYDGSYDISMWQKSRDFALDEKMKWAEKHRDQEVKDIVKFTYFINPAYLLNPPRDKNGRLIRSELAKLYNAPAGHVGSNIGWGDNSQDISDRIDQMISAYLEGHEIGSHTVGHYDGTKFSFDDWYSEFAQFNTILDKVFVFNNLREREIPFKNEIIGFRAPQLGRSEALYQVLSRFNFRYDTSKLSSQKESYWPQKDKYGIWNFPLASIRASGTENGVPSMDFNFCYRHSKKFLSQFDIIDKEPEEIKRQKIADRKEIMSMKAWDPEKKKEIRNKGKECLNLVPEDVKAEAKNEMKDLYNQYFNEHYYGNRAPIHLGHHFSKWMSGAYSETFFEFADKVCNMAEVKCVTYKELMNFLEQKSPAEIAAYQKGNFEKIPNPQPKSLHQERIWDLNVTLSLEQDNLKFAFDGRDSRRSDLVKYVSVNGVATKIQDEIKLDEIRKHVNVGETALLQLSVKNKFSKEVLGATYKIESVGTEKERVNLQNIEESVIDGHCEVQADENTLDFRRGNQGM